MTHFWKKGKHAKCISEFKTNTFAGAPPTGIPCGQPVGGQPITKRIPSKTTQPRAANEGGILLGQLTAVCKHTHTHTLLQL